MLKHKNYTFVWVLYALVMVSAILMPHTAMAAPEMALDSVLSPISRLDTSDTTKHYDVDFDYIREVNPDTVGWLFQGESEMNLPIMQTVDNVYYSKRTFARSIDRTGALYIDFENASDFSDQVNYLYGGNHAEGGPFIQIADFFEADYYQQHSCFRLITPQTDYQLDVFAGYKTKLTDQDSWLIEPWRTEAQFSERIAQIMQTNTIEVLPETMPSSDDRIFVFITQRNSKTATRYILYARMRPIVFDDKPSIDLNKVSFDEQPTGNGYVTLPTLGKEFMVYAQNDPMWEDLYYESKQAEIKRRFGQGGCGPTAVAIAVANLVDHDSLAKIFDYAAEDIGYTFCECAVNSVLCNHRHAQYQVRTADEVLRYLPLIMADFSCGNNSWGIKSRNVGRQGTNMKFLKNVCEVYDLMLREVVSIQEAIEALKQENTMVIGCTIRGGPFTTTSHYVTMAGVDDEYLYIIDPLYRDSYKAIDTLEILEIVAPGVVRVPLENAGKCHIYSFIILTNPNG
ncbi:MAG: class B sortase [Clostridiales bacterium]|nr:class B sortase [Clostridiales bacterium]